MTNPDIRAVLGRERLNTLLAHAEAARTAGRRDCTAGRRCGVGPA